MGGIPVLMYHALLEKEDLNAHPVHVLVSCFEQQMEWLYENGYESISMDEMLEIFKSKRPLEGRKMVITFDDGYLSVHRYALPILARYNFKATLFLTTLAVGLPSYRLMEGYEENGQPSDDRPLNWPEITDMARMGWAIEAHGCRHLSLPNISKAEMESEIAGSQKCIEERLNKRVRYFAYPFGDYNRQVLAAVREKYEAACAVHSGKAQIGEDTYRLSRIEVNRGDTIALFSKKVKNGYATKTEKYRSILRNAAYKSLFLKDMIHSFVGILQR
jgi:peptidoglycan/xylan/chitin deacetylase (PgdA/CDA1 family)